MGERDFRLWWVALLVMEISFQMLEVAIGWEVYSLHRSALDLGFIGLAEFVPRLLFALPAGALADIVDRRKFLIVTEVLYWSEETKAQIVRRLHCEEGPVELLVFRPDRADVNRRPVWQGQVPLPLLQKGFHGEGISWPADRTRYGRLGLHQAGVVLEIGGSLIKLQTYATIQRSASACCTVPNLGGQRVHRPGLVFGGGTVTKSTVDSPLSRDQDAHLLPPPHGCGQLCCHHLRSQAAPTMRRGRGHRGHRRRLQRAPAGHRHLRSETAQRRHHFVPLEATPGPVKKQTRSACLGVHVPRRVEKPGVQPRAPRWHLAGGNGAYVSIAMGPALQGHDHVGQRR